MPLLSRRSTLKLFGAAAVTHAASTRPPNFVLITCDDLGYADTQPYRADVSYTPNLARMGRQGMKFTSFYAAAVCSPSRAALMTGCYPKRVGIEQGSWHAVLMPGDWHGLNPSEITVAKLLQKRGYATACIGKWHLGDQPEFLPTRHGFDYYYGLPYSNDMRPTPNANPLFEHPHPPLPLLRNEAVVQEVTDQSFLTASYTEEALRFIRANQRKPFFLYLPHSMVHQPHAAGERFRGKSGKGLYEDALMEVDWSVGGILDTLNELGLAKDTLVLFISDNGGTKNGLNTPLRGFKGSTFEGGMRVPALAWWPGRVPAGSTCREVAANMDILPTFAALTGGAAPKDRTIDGQDISGLLTGKQGAKSKHAALYYYSRAELQAVRAGAWKLFATGELYNLDDDVAESRNAAASHPTVVAELNKKLDAARKDLGDGSAPGAGCRPVGKAKGPLRFWIPRHPDSGHPPHAPVHHVPGSPVG